jgi:hypothetical protein
MATNNRGGNRGGSNRGRRGQNNNPEGRNQYSGLMSTARENPVTAAVAVGGAVAAGVFLWSRRNQISDQISSLSDQISDWREGMGWSGGEFGAEESGSAGSFMANSNSGSTDATSGKRGGKKSQSQIAEEALTLKETGKATA